MDKKTTGIIATLATTFFCGLPGLFSMCMGVTSAAAGFIPGADIDVFGSSDPSAAIGMGFALLCLSIILIAIPIVVGMKTLRQKPE